VTPDGGDGKYTKIRRQTILPLHALVLLLPLTSAQALPYSKCQVPKSVKRTAHGHQQGKDSCMGQIDPASRILRRFDQVYHFATRWIKTYIWNGMIVSAFFAAIVSLAVNGTSNLRPLAKWPILHLFATNYWIFAVPLMLSILYIFFYGTHLFLLVS